ncbi:uncharacterized protein LOC133180379 [Saccostrea echinata]|uniref:uncharacterized protein LOC133180379 n=1 Tax=Saccostrea echinata TaxID=191078 RepID=UPI002A7FD09C|nr:uncharacterized protein LOC133180379 [Saccostrea echinata]
MAGRKGGSTNDVWLNSRVIVIDSTPRGPRFRQVRRRINFSSEAGDGACATPTPAASPKSPADTTMEQETDVERRLASLEEKMASLERELKGRRVLRKKCSTCNYRHIRL